MKQNMDCIRGVLLAVESMSNGRTEHIFCSDEQLQWFIDESPSLQGFTPEEVDYHVIQCINSDLFIDAKKIPFGFTFVDLSPSGHTLLNNIRGNKVWSATKEIIKPLPSAALSIVSEVASSVIKKTLGLP